ncbi:hypothetical protein ILYODFUR_025681 [Ilyodon furcidens]|uniref:Uncharacterized protein n=1 Tax=Ilyodon furcidens TaxID=33524 RepID=A0ABV0V633_9TELE
MSPGSLWIFDNFFHRWHQSSWLQGDRCSESSDYLEAYFSRKRPTLPRLSDCHQWLPTWTRRPSGWYPGFPSRGVFVLLDL